MKFNEPMLRDGALEGKTIIVTGGGTGLGRSMSKYFLELGANVVIASASFVLGVSVMFDNLLLKSATDFRLALV